MTPIHLEWREPARNPRMRNTFMASRRISLWLIALMAVIAALLGASTNVATGVLPDAWQAHLWLAWPISGVLLASFIGLNVWYATREQPPPAEGLRRAYLERMTGEWNALRLQAVDSRAADAGSQPLPLEKVYVALDTTTPRPRELHGEGMAERERPLLSAVEALCGSASGRLLLLGQPGSGKSTFARYLSLTLAEALLRPGAFALPDRLPGWSGPARLPILAPLGRLAAGLRGDSAQDIEAGLRAHVERDVADCGAALLEDLRQTGGLVIFDGLDEVPDARRERLKAALGRFAGEYPLCRVLVTCRTHSYRHDAAWRMDWPVAELAYFSDEKIADFIGRWYEALRSRPDRGAGDGYRRKEATLRAALAPDDPRGLRELARTPLLLTVMAIVHGHKELPGSRVAVYRECVDLLLQRWQQQKVDEGGRRSLPDALAPWGVTDRQLEQGLWEVAYRAHEVGEADRLGGGGGRALIGGDTLRGVLHRHFAQPDDQRTHRAVEIFLDYCHHANGLVLYQGTFATAADGVPEPIYAFPHLTFEEYLAARHLKRVKAEGSFTRKAAELAGEPAWREVVRFLGEYLCHDRDGADIDQAHALLARLCPEEAPETDPDWRRILLAGELLQALRRETSAPDRQLEARVPRRLAALLEEPAALRDAPQERAAAGRALARVGDPRPGVGLRDGLPDLAWVRIPGTAAVRDSGRFPGFTGLRLGKGARPDLNTPLDEPPEWSKEDWPAPAEPVEIATFELAAHPVTVAQFRPFVEQGYGEARYWSKAGRDDRGDRPQPHLWDDPAWTVDNHPVVGMTWYDAEAYCHWLNERLDLLPGTIRLPTEAEWEWAARGPEGRRYPWGDPWETWRCNSVESGINRTSAAGCFPGGAADWWRALDPAGAAVYDLAGNLWEWTASEYAEDYAGACRPASGAGSGGPRVVRGGSWYGGPEGLRSAARLWYFPRNWLYDIGFRLARTITL